MNEKEAREIVEEAKTAMRPMPVAEAKGYLAGLEAERERVKPLVEVMTKISEWLGLLIKSNETAMRTCRFESMTDAYRADIKNYAATKGHVDKALAAYAQTEGKEKL